jgi:hypothetical protein
MTPARSRTAVTATALAAGLVGLLLVLVTWAAAIGPDDLLRGDGPATTPREAVVSDSPSPSDDSPEMGEDSRDYLPDPPADASLLGVVVFTLGVLALLAVLVVGSRLLLRRLRRWLAERDPAEPDPEAVEMAVLTPAQAAEELARAADHAQEHLGEGSPRNAIVACWTRFEQDAARAGLRRQEWETPAELVLRFFDAVDADAAAVQRLAVLYREARFSDHEVGEPERRAAAEALEAITTSLRQVTP